MRAELKKHSLVIGGTRGIGRSVAKALARDGYELSVVGRRLPAESDEPIHNARYWAVDILDYQSFETAWGEIISQGGKLSNLVFCQRYRAEGDQWAGEIETGLTATMKIIERLVDECAYTSEASIVVVSSLASWLVTDDEQPVGYHVAKAGLDQMVRYYAVALGPKGIRVNSVNPCRVLKEESKEFYFNNLPIYELYKSIVPLGRMVTPEDVANVVSFLSGPMSSFVTGQSLVVDGGLSLQLQERLARLVSPIENLGNRTPAAKRSN